MSIKVEDSDLQEIEGSRRRVFQAVPHPLTAGVILSDIAQYQRHRVIVICNTVSQSQGLFRDLAALNENDDLNITLLHSRFLPEDRAKKEIELQQKFAQNWQTQDDPGCYVLVATQVIEAGLNITCEVMHTQLCPMNSLLQRAGRCARFRNEQGEVYVYRTIEVEPENSELARVDLESESEAKKKKQKFLPYSDDICEQTWLVLEAHTQSEQVKQNVSFRTEEQWINQVHGGEDSLNAEQRKNERAEFARCFHRAIFAGDRSTADELIRFVDSRSVFIWEEPIFLDDEQIDPKKLLAFSVPITTLCKVWREVQNLGYEIDWIFKRIEAPKGKAAETYSLPICTLINSRTDLVNSFQILVNPRYVHYDDAISLLIGVDVVGNNFSSPNKPKKQVSSEYSYHMDNYVGHLVLMWKCWREPFTTRQNVNGAVKTFEYGSVRHELLQAGGKLLKTKILPEATDAETENLFEYLVFLAIFTHDLGKLQIKWQDAMRGWQKIAYENKWGKNPRSHLLAHTDYNPEDKQQRDALKAYETKHKRPNHAIESAYLANNILQQSLAPLLRDHFHTDTEQMFRIAYTVMMAAGRHHSAWTKGWENKDIRKVGKIELHADAGSAIASSWRCLVHFLPTTLPSLAEPKLSKNIYPVTTGFKLDELSSDDIEYLQLYSLIVRALRLCDMRSVQL
jgi:CRISPR-associated endonuclease/helicase Cas3